MRTARKPLPLLAMAAAVLGLALLQSAGVVSPEVLLSLVPLAMLLLPLVGGRYVGEDALARLAARCAPAGRRRTAARLPVVLGSRVVAPRGGLLLACSLARRGPPVLA